MIDIGSIFKVDYEDTNEEVQSALEEIFEPYTTKLPEGEDYTYYEVTDPDAIENVIEENPFNLSSIFVWVI